MSWFNFRKEKRSNEPYKETNHSVCDEVNEGIGLIQKLLNLKDYGAMHQSAFFSAVSLISNYGIISLLWKKKLRLMQTVLFLRI